MVPIPSPQQDCRVHPFLGDTPGSLGYRFFKFQLQPIFFSGYVESLSSRFLQNHVKPVLLMEEIRKKKRINDGIRYRSTGAGFVPSTVSLMLSVNVLLSQLSLVKHQHDLSTALSNVEG